jgi:hypothetical protein
MPRYFFHVYDGALSQDKEGDDLPDIGAAIQEAAQIAKELLDDNEIENVRDFRMEVLDEQGNVVRVIRPPDVMMQ